MTVRWGILGCGDVCEVKSGPAFQKASGSELVAVMRRNGELARDYARRHGVSAWYDDAGALIEDERVDAVYVASPPGSHLDLALRVCAAGKPAYVEKPMARNHAECERMVEAFTQRGLPLYVAYYRRALPRFRKAKEIVDSGRLGNITGVSCRYASAAHRAAVANERAWRVRAEESGGGLFLDLASHTLDMLDFLFGPLADVIGAAANVASGYAVEDSVVLQFRIPSGALGTGTWNFASQLGEDLIVVSGSDGELRLSAFGQEPVELRTPAGLESFHLPNPPHVQLPLIQTVVDALEGRGECPSTGVSAARTSAVVDRALLSYYGSRGDGFWRDPQAWPGFRARQRGSRS